jgi:hypothetical protein
MLPWFTLLRWSFKRSTTMPRECWAMRCSPASQACDGCCRSSR